MADEKIRRPGARAPEDSPSGADPTLEDALEEKEQELRKMTRNVKGGALNPPRDPEEREDNESLIAQAADPDAQES